MNWRLLWLLLILLVVGCAKTLDGKYVSDGGAGGVIGLSGISVEFKPSGKAYVTLPMAGTTAGTYTIDEDKVIVTIEGKPMVFTLEKDGRLTGGPLGAVLKKAD